MADFDPSRLIYISFEEDHKMMLHAKYLSSSIVDY
jgi:hypothetical protein